MISQRIFELDFGCILFPDDCWNFHQDGTMTSESREKFLEEHSKGFKEPLKILMNYEKTATEKIAKILEIEAEWIPETEEEEKARWVKEKKEATEKYLFEVADLKEALYNRMNN